MCFAAGTVAGACRVLRSRKIRVRREAACCCRRSSCSPVAQRADSQQVPTKVPTCQGAASVTNCPQPLCVAPSALCAAKAGPSHGRLRRARPGVVQVQTVERPRLPSAGPRPAAPDWLGRIRGPLGGKGWEGGGGELLQSRGLVA